MLNGVFNYLGKKKRDYGRDLGIFKWKTEKEWIMFLFWLKKNHHKNQANSFML